MYFSAILGSGAYIYLGLVFPKIYVLENSYLGKKTTCAIWIFGGALLTLLWHFGTTPEVPQVYWSVFLKGISWPGAVLGLYSAYQNKHTRSTTGDALNLIEPEVG
jgi:hypothetical protein